MSSLPMNPPDLSHWIVKLSDHYSDGGAFGDVWKCMYNRDSVFKEVAVKALRFQFMPAAKESDGDDKYVRLARRELGIWRRLNHKNIVPFLGIAYGFGPHVALVSLWMPHGTLRAFLVAHEDKLAVFHKLQLLLDVADGLLYLHSQPFVHGDLTSNNVLIDGECSARLVDFGLASLVGDIPEGMAYLHASTKRTGTVRWAAPELFSQNTDQVFQRTTKTDIYSFGHIVFQVFSGKEPWSEVREDIRVALCLSQGQRPARSLLPPIDDRHWDLIESCWRQPSERPTTNDVVLALRGFLAAECPTDVSLCDLLQSPRITQNINPQDQESSIEQMIESTSCSEGHTDDSTISRSRVMGSLVENGVAEAEMISERGEPALREMYPMTVPEPPEGLARVVTNNVDRMDPFTKGFHLPPSNTMPPPPWPNQNPTIAWTPPLPGQPMPDQPMFAYNPYDMKSAGWPSTPALAEWPAAMPPQSSYGGYVPQQWQHPILQPPPMRVPKPLGDSASAALEQSDNTDRMDPFTEGSHYGPVLEPFICKVVGAVVKISPLLAPPVDAQEDYLRWNMIFHTSRCYRTSESKRSWIKGRNEPATHPRVTHIRIVSRTFPWMINAHAQNPKIGVTCGEVLDTISAYLHADVGEEEYDCLPLNRKRQVWDSYRLNRSTDPNVPGEVLGDAMKRLDYLGTTPRFGGIVVDDDFVKTQCGDAFPCTFELKCLLSYPMTPQELREQQQRQENPLGDQNQSRSPSSAVGSVFG